MRKILITGASGGIAQALIDLLRNDYLILLGRDHQQLEALYGDRSHLECHQIDITDDQAVEGLMKDIYSRHERVDILINNAGYAIYDDFDRLGREEARAMFEVNTFATMALCQKIGGRMKEAGRGHIVNIVSMSGLIASAKSSLYSASKFAAIGYSNALRLELARYGVWVTTVNPGPVATKFFDQADPDGTYLKSVEKFTIQPDYLARKIVAILGKNKRELNLPWTLNVAHKCYTLFPGLADLLARTVFNFK